MRSLRRRATVDSITLLPPFVNNLCGLAAVRRSFLPGFSVPGAARMVKSYRTGDAASGGFGCIKE